MVQCTKCGAENPAGKKFCGDCGAALTNLCPQCGAENPGRKKFCGECGGEIKGQGVTGLGMKGLGDAALTANPLTPCP